MDKFGIFKLLNSFYDYYEKNKSAQKDNPRPQENAKNDAFGGFAGTPKQKKATPQQPTAPLQNTMIATMTSHDDFVKRVLKNNRDN